MKNKILSNLVKKIKRKLRFVIMIFRIIFSQASNIDKGKAFVHYNEKHV